MSLFSNPNPFGQSQQQQQQQPSSAPSLFGGSTQTAQSQSGSTLFGNPQNTQPQGNSLFGASAQNNAPTRPSLFTSTSNTNTQNQGGTLFGGSLGQPQQQQQNPAGSTFAGSNFGGSTLGGSTLVNQPQNSLQQSQNRPLWQPTNLQMREKGILEQIETLHRKWKPEYPECVFKTHFYNYFEDAPMVQPDGNEDLQDWEAALAKKPGDNFVPALYTGYEMLADRLRNQIKFWESLQRRMHEISESLAAQQQQHNLDVSVRAAEAKRKHVALSQRCLKLATNVQVLRKRGYVMDVAEEDLRNKLSELEQKASDPGLTSRQEEIWARMVGIRERTKMLQADMARAGESVNSKTEDGLDEEVLRRTKKILGDYDSQISHLNKEVEAIRKDFSDWQDGNGARRADG